MKSLLIIYLLLCSFYNYAAPGISMTLDGNNYQIMIVGVASASVTYDIVNTTGGNVAIPLSDLDKSSLPASTTVQLKQPNDQSCNILPNNATCKLTITLDPESGSAVQDLYQTGPEFKLSVIPGLKQPLYPVKDQQISVKVFSKWTAISKAPFLPALTNVITSVSGTIYASQGTDFYSLDTSDNEWTKAYEPASGTPMDSITSSVTAGDGTIYVGTTGEGVFTPNPDGTKYWTAEGTGLSGIIVYKLFYYSSDLYAATNVGLYSLDGSTWTKDTTANVPSGVINDIYVSGSTMYVATNANGVHKFDGITWTKMTGIDGQINSFTRDSSGNLFAATDVSALSELPSGKDVWEAITETGLPNANITGVSALLDNGLNYLFAFPAGDTGIYISQDAGKTWVAFNGAAVDNLHVYKLFRSGSTYYLATSAGVFSRED